jgi:hypothetical protein
MVANVKGGGQKTPMRGMETGTTATDSYEAANPR